MLTFKKDTWKNSAPQAVEKKTTFDLISLYNTAKDVLDPARQAAN